MVQWGAGELERAGVERARFEAQLLLAHVLGATRGELLAALHPPASAAHAAAFRHLIERRSARIPFAYLTGRREFYGLSFAVSPSTLIPRPETELLVEVALDRMRQLPAPVMADACTGTGCVAVACAVHETRARVVASDVCPSAARLARQNAAHHGVARRVCVVCADLLSAVRASSVDLIAANPPYIPSGDLGGLAPEVRDHEPRTALDGGPDGLAVLRALASDALRALRLGGTLMTEVAAGQSGAVAAMLHDLGYGRVRVHRDLARIERVVVGRKPGGEA